MPFVNIAPVVAGTNGISPIFLTTVGVVDGAKSGNWDIEFQSLNSGNDVACNVDILIGPDPLTP